MKAIHQQWIAEAVRLGRAQRFADAYHLASLVVCEDENNLQALWLVATMTNSFHERRLALKALLRRQPNHFHARQLYNAIHHKAEYVSPTVFSFPCASTGPCDEVHP